MSPNIKKGLVHSFLTLGAIGVIFFLSTDVFAAQKISAGRKLWDTIMLWVNFGILVFLFIKYAQKPLMSFLKGEKKKIEEDLNSVETKLTEAQSILNAEEAKLKGAKERMQKIKEEIIEFGHIEKEKIIERAQQTADQMIEDSRRKAEYQFETARKTIIIEMMDIAVSIAREKIKKGITPEDDEALINQLITDLNTTSGNFN